MLEILKDNRTRVLYHVAASDVGGSVYSLFDLITCLDLKRFIPIVLITRNECEEFTNSITSFGFDTIYEDIYVNSWLRLNNNKGRTKIKWRIKSIGRFIRHFVNAIRIAKLIRRNKIDIVHTNDENLIDASLGAYLSNCKHVWHIRSRIGKDGLLSHFLGERIVLNTINILSNRVVVNSKSTFEPWKRILLSKKVLLIHNGININRFSEGLGCLKTEYNLPIYSRIIMMISTSPDFDGLNYFIEAVNLACKVSSDIFCFMIGRTDTCSKEYIELQKRKLEDLNLQQRFFFTGYRTDIPDILSEANVIIEPMQNGSWSRVVLEAMAAGVPVIGVEEDKISDFITDGITGILVKSQNEIGQALIELLNNEAKMKSISNNAKLHVISNFSNKRYAENIMQVYDSLV